MKIWWQLIQQQNSSTKWEFSGMTPLQHENSGIRQLGSCENLKKIPWHNILQPVNIVLLLHWLHEELFVAELVADKLHTNNYFFIVTCFIATIPILSEVCLTFSKKSFNSDMDTSLICSLILGIFESMISQKRYEYTRGKYVCSSCSKVFRAE